MFVELGEASPSSDPDLEKDLRLADALEGIPGAAERYADQINAVRHKKAELDRDTSPRPL